ncbi:endonuclease [Jannaschia pagri]|uniref:Endonuclease n=1 Tax=Jannaschia pagri TaxID=2829797 RepID=A0ABQ4NMV8_9RHOB|nr:MULTISPECIES: endonuclease/exonuclease/phosphatase family protein [unclassified Jannaschia]GIT91916.1 endonuclease [Jannaschia sp. AI_61]GIT95750.1 endonuclease [Jannaschia sp. AI_62]
MTPTVARLSPLTQAQRHRIEAAPRTADSHRALLAGLPAMNAVEVDGTAPRDALPASVSVVAWNVERCLFPEVSAAHLAPYAPDIVLLSEVDNGMARTAQRHTTEAMAQAMGMAYVFGVEFQELALGGPTERPFCTDDFNALGWHGNAILSAAPPTRLTMERLDDHGHWFVGPKSDPDQPRVGGRMALLAEVPTASGPICVVSTHLESNADAAHRGAQFDRLLDTIDAFSPGLPVILGGDLNTGNHMPPDFDWRAETLFAAAEARGYDWSATPEGPTTQPSLITPHPTRKMTLDWFATRGISVEEKALINATSSDGTPLSDHHAVWCRGCVGPV